MTGPWVSWGPTNLPRGSWCTFLPSTLHLPEIGHRNYTPDRVPKGLDGVTPRSVQPEWTAQLISEGGPSCPGKVPEEYRGGGPRAPSSCHPVCSVAAGAARCGQGYGPEPEEVSP